MKKYVITLILCVMSVPLLLLTSCEDRGPEYISDYDVVYTNHQSSMDFSTVKTYQLIDTLMFLTPNGKSMGSLTHNFDEVVLDRVKSNLDDLGWTMITPAEEGVVEADIVVTVSSITTTYINQYWYDDWWYYWDWYGGFYPGWGWGPGYYPWYGYPMYYTTYDTGTVFIEMINPKQQMSADKKIPIVWVGLINGLLEGSNINARINKNIDQAFMQSPYLMDK